MTSNAKTSSKVDSKQLARLLKVNVHLATATLVVAGLVCLWASLGRHSLLRQPDALLGLTNRTLLTALGLLHLGLSVWLLATRKYTSQALLMLWLGADCLVYRLGMAWLKATAPVPLVKLLAWKLDASPKALGVCWSVLIAYLVVGGLAHLMLQRHQLKRQEDAAFLRRWKQTREAGTAPHR